MGNVVALMLFVLPLGIDTFAIAAAVGASRLSGWSRWRISTIFVIFEGGTPLLGLGLGLSVGQAVGDVAGYLSSGLLIVLGGYLWRSEAADGDDDDDDDDEAAKARQLIDARGLALIGLALSISLDELAIGFSFGLGSNLVAPATFIIAIAIQALVVSQLGLSLGAWISGRLREHIERVVGPILMFLGGYPLAVVFLRAELVSASSATLASILVIILAAVIVYHRFATAVHAVPGAPSGNQHLVPVTSTGQHDDLPLRSPGSWSHQAAAALRPRSGRHRARRHRRGDQ